MFKRPKITYTMNDSPVTRQEIEQYPERSLFFVSKTGEILLITEHNREEAFNRLVYGEFMYKDQLEELIFGN